MLTDTSEGDSSGHRLRRRELYRNGVTTSVSHNGTNGASHHHNGNSHSNGVDANHHKRVKRTLRYYRVQHEQNNYNATTILLILFVLVAALIGVLEWLSIYKLPNYLQETTTTEDSSSSAWEETELPAGLLPKEEEELEVLHNNNRPLNYNYVQDDPDKEPILTILRQAGINTTMLDYDTYQSLPPWSQIQRLFGTEPRIYGLGDNDQENCAAFRNSTDPTIRFFGIAGAFNSGTNLLASLMIQNCQITERMLVYGEKSKGVRWQVPWYVRVRV
jgi:hypothetical protein